MMSSYFLMVNVLLLSAKRSKKRQSPAQRAAIVATLMFDELLKPSKHASRWDRRTLSMRENVGRIGPTVNGSNPTGNT